MLPCHILPLSLSFNPCLLLLFITVDTVSGSWTWSNHNASRLQSQMSFPLEVKSTLKMCKWRREAEDDL